MCKAIRSSVVIAMVVASSSLASLVDNQLSNIGLNNAIDLLHGSQDAHSLQNLVVNNEQSSQGVCGGGPACQSLMGALQQVGNAWGNCALVGLNQNLLISGVQKQDIGNSCDPAAQLQTLGLGATQALARSDGEGGGDALHLIVLNANQDGANAASQLHEASSIIGMQQSSLTGQAGATALISSALNVSTAQTQGAM